MRKLILGLLVCVSLFGSDFEDAKKACDYGYGIGCLKLGFMYEYNRGLEQDNFKAVKFYKKACDYGISNGCLGLGYMYDSGRGVRQDSQKALKLYGKACDMRSEDGCENYASLKKELGQ